MGHQGTSIATTAVFVLLSVTVTVADYPDNTAEIKFQRPAFRRQLFGIPGTNCSFCPESSNCSSQSHVFCENEAPYCFVEIARDESGNTEIRRGCSKEADCYHRWWKFTFKGNSQCPTFGDSQTPLIAYPFSTACYYCCQSFGMPTPCNSALAPSSPIAYTPLHFMTPPPGVGR